MDGSALRNLRLLKSLVGERNLKNVLLTTTHWSGVTPEEGERREKELRETENFWKGLLERGASLGRYDGDRQSGLELLRKLAPLEPRALDIQSEIVDQGKKLADTSAGRCVKEECFELEKILGKTLEIQTREEGPHEVLARGSDGVEEFQEQAGKRIQPRAAWSRRQRIAESPAKGFLT